MPSYSNKFQNLEHKDAERWKNHATPPLIHFLPEWQNDTNHGAPTQQSTLLKVEPKSRSANADTYKFTYELFEDGTVEDLIRFLDAFEEVLTNKPLNTPTAKFNFFRNMLTGNALERWNDKLTSITQRETTLPDGTVQAAPGLTEATFKQVKKPGKAHILIKTQSIRCMNIFVQASNSPSITAS